MKWLVVCLFEFAYPFILFYFVIFFNWRDPSCRSLWSIHYRQGVCLAWPHHNYGVFQGSYISDFHAVLIQSFCEGQEAEEGREQMGPFLRFRSFPKQIRFIWLCGHVFPDILLCGSEDIAAKRFTLVRISVFKLCPFFPRITGKLVYQPHYLNF